MTAIERIKFGFGEDQLCCIALRVRINNHDSMPMLLGKMGGDIACKGRLPDTTLAAEEDDVSRRELVELADHRSPYPV